VKNGPKRGPTPKKRPFPFHGGTIIPVLKKLSRILDIQSPEYSGSLDFTLEKTSLKK
jgi:hypothetical protein